MIRFAALLRREGLPITLVQTTDAVRALEHLDLGDRDELRLGLRTVFVGRPEELPAFDRAFDAFWRPESAADVGRPGLVQPTPSGDENGSVSGGTQKREALALETWAGEDEPESGEPLGVPAVSDQEALSGRDFSTFTPDQLDEVYRLTVQIARRLARRLSRRRRPVGRRGRIDLRRTLRANLSRGDLIDLKFRRRKRRKLRLVLLCDVSGSMDLYSRFLLQFLFALDATDPGVRASERTFLPAGAPATDRRARLVRRHADRGIPCAVQSRLVTRRRPSNDRHRAFRRLGYR